LTATRPWRLRLISAGVPASTARARRSGQARTRNRRTSAARWFIDCSLVSSEQETKEAPFILLPMRQLRALTDGLVIAVIVLVGLLDLVVYTGIVQSDGAATATDATPIATPPAGAGAKGAALAAADADDALPGRYVASQGIQHTAAYPLRQHVPFCKDTSAPSNSCYASNPPTSGLHLPIERNVTLADGNSIDIPPNRGIYEFAIPREAIPHIEEHGGVYVGYNCDGGCGDALTRAKAIVTQELSLGARVVMSPDADLEDGTIGVVSWTRIDSFAASDYSDQRLRSFIKAHNCRFDPEGFCKEPLLN
jgi:Protein of unknown function (DUF3105)